MTALLKSALRWLHPGLGLKRWLGPLLLGLVILGLGIGLFLRDIYAEGTYPRFLQIILLLGWPRWIRATLFSAVGLWLVAYSIYQLNRTLLAAFLPNEASLEYIAEQVYQHRQRRPEGPKIVAIGGGTGLSVLLRGLKRYSSNLTAIVTVADDGGSSGRLRRELGMLPPGDFRNCITGLADDESLISQLFQYRFRSGQGLQGHSFGNLFITAMAEVTGSFEQAIYESGRVLKIQGAILPSTLQDVTLLAEFREDSGGTRKVRGESAIPGVKLPIERVYLQPDDPRPFPPVLRAILNADLIIAGPGSLYTSIIPNLLIPELVQAIRVSTAPKIYICNVATQPGETDGYSLDQHMQAIEAHTWLFGAGSSRDWLHQPANGHQARHTLFNFVLANNNQKHPIPPTMNLQPIEALDPPGTDYFVVKADVVDEAHPWRHDADKMAQAIIHWYKHYQH